MTQHKDSFLEAKPKLLKVAYNMLGSLSEAEDIVQEAWLRWNKTNSDEVESSQAYLMTIVTRLCLDYLQSARNQREVYSGPWLPEPIIDLQGQPGPDQLNELAETLSYGLLALLEKLSPSERAVFILRKAFDFRHGEIAEVLSITEDNARQLDRRAKLRLNQADTRFETNREQHEQLLREFVLACANGDLSALSNMLSEQVTAYSDGGGKVSALLRPINGRDRVVNYLKRVSLLAQQNHTIQLCRINGQLGVASIEEGAIVNALTISITNGKIDVIYNVRNPDKLGAVI